MEEMKLSNGDFRSCIGSFSFDRAEGEELCTAFSTREKIRLKICVPRGLAVISANADLFSDERELNPTVSFTFCDINGAFDVFVGDFPKLSVGLYFYRLKLSTATGVFYAVIQNGCLIFTNEITTCGQITVFRYSHLPDKSFAGGIMYHIFVDRFNKGSVPVQQKKGTVINPDWDHGIPEYPEFPGAPLKNNVFFGGTLWGVIEKLDYLRSLGVNILYLSPIFDSPSNHKYDTADYMTVDEMFGGEKALTELLSKAHKKGIKVILDGVFNHTGADSKYFNKYGNFDSVGAYQSKESPYYDWYDFGQYKNGYCAWWDIEILPRIYPDRKNCGDYFVGCGGVIEKYAKMGIDGLRLDVADELSDDFLKKIRKKLKTDSEKSLLIGEVWEDASNKIAYDVRKQYFLGKELDGVMNYPLRKGCIEYFVKGETQSLAYALLTVMMNLPASVRSYQMNFLGTHDTERILTVLAGEERFGRSNEELSVSRLSDAQRKIAETRLKMAFATIAFLPGIPSIYYGDETGLEGYSDPFNRMPFPWNRIDKDLLNHFRKIGKMRRENKVFSENKIEIVALEPDYLVYRRFNKTKSLLVFVCNATLEKPIAFDKATLDLVSGVNQTEFSIEYGKYYVFEV